MNIEYQKVDRENSKFIKYGTEFKIHTEFVKIKSLPRDLNNVLYFNIDNVEYKKKNGEYSIHLPLINGNSLKKLFNKIWKDQSILLNDWKLIMRALLIFKQRLIKLNEMGFYHNNIKSDHLIMDENLEIKLIDFFSLNNEQNAFAGLINNDIKNLDLIMSNFSKCRQFNGEVNQLVEYPNNSELLTVETLNYVNLQKYLGVWYEIAKIPQFYEPPNSFNTTATYYLNDDGNIVVKNTTFLMVENDIIESTIEGSAVPQDDSNSKLTVGFEGFPSGNYYIIRLGHNYEYSVVTNENKTCLWILSRSRDMEEEILNQLYIFLVTSGYDLSNFVLTSQS